MEGNKLDMKQKSKIQTFFFIIIISILQSSKRSNQFSKLRLWQKLVSMLCRHLGNLNICRVDLFLHDCL